MIIVRFLLMIGVVSVLCVLNGAVLKTMWGWFLVPLGLPPINVAMAVGIGTIVTLLVYTPTPLNKDEDKDNTVYLFIVSLVKLCILLLVGWIAHKCL